MTVLNNPQATPNPNQNQNRPARQTNWIIQLIFQLIMIRVVYTLFTNAKNNAALNKAGLFPSFKNYFEQGEVFDIYGVVTNDVRIDFENLESGQLVYANENKVYNHKFNNKFEPFRVTIKPNPKFFKDILENLYLTIFIIPHKAYLSKSDVFYKSKFKEGIDGHYIVKTIPLTKVKKVTKSSSVHLIPSKSSKEGSPTTNEAGGFKNATYDDAGSSRQFDKKEPEEEEEGKYFIPRVDINLVHDLRQHTLVRNDVYFEHFTKHHEHRIYDPMIYLSQFWVLEEHLVLITPELLEGVSDKRSADSPVAGTPDSRPHTGGQPSSDATNQHLDLAGAETDDMKPTLGDHTETDPANQLPPPKVAAPGELELLINYATCFPVYYMLLNNMSTSTSNNIWGLDNAKELDTLKKTLLNTNIYFLIFSALFILLHTVFSIFAVKNDIQFWYNNKSMEGLSTLTLVGNFISEIIIALYIFDNEKSSFIILFEILVSVASSFWKLTKAVKIKFTTSYPFFKISTTTTKVEDETRQYDKVAIKYMSILLAPCIVGYAIYSLYYNKHKSWYSYIISVLAGSVYTFGFIMMTPQLYINYKLKSVEHLPWRALVYKSLNTFVDDVASFLIEMPMLHRLSCFRDDIIFFCYLYQRWKYKVDPNRNKPRSQVDKTKEKESLENKKDSSKDAQSANVTRLNDDPKIKN